MAEMIRHLANLFDVDVHRSLDVSGAFYLRSRKGLNVVRRVERSISLLI